MIPEASMRRCFLVVGAILLSSGLPGLAIAQVSPEPSQVPASVNVLGSVTNGNTTIVFEPANPIDIDTPALTTWDSFATAHPAIASALAFKPSLMNDIGYLNKHPELRDFFLAHPQVRNAMLANPGNFAAIPPRPGE
jgi:hypothetical protein